jgi:ketosteroid isomerase-like protein
MSEQTVELVRALQPSGIDLVEALAGDEGAFVEGISAVFDPALECAFVANESSGFTTLAYRGADGFVEGWREWLSPWESYRIDAEEFIDAGDQVVVLARVQARTRRGGVEMQHAPGAVWTIEEGRIRRVEFYLEGSQALEVAGRRGT